METPAKFARPGAGFILGIALAAVIAALAVRIQLDAAVSRDPAAYIVYIRAVMMGTAQPPGTVERVLNPFILSNYLLYLPAVLLTLVGFGVETAHKLACFLLFGWSFSHLLGYVRAYEGRAAWVLLPTYTLVGLVFPVDGFGQKEHLFLLLILPYLLAALAPAQDNVRLSLGGGVAAACALVIKPYLIGPWVLIEGWRMLRGGARSVFNRLNLLVVAVQVAYYAAVLILVARLPDSHGVVAAVLDIKRSYLRADWSTLFIRRFTLIWLVGGLGLAAALMVRRLRHGAVVWLLAVVAAIASVVVQGNGLDYHWHLVGALAGLGLAWVVAETEGRRVGAAALAVFFVLVALRTYPFAQAEWRNRAGLTVLVAATRPYGADYTLAMFSTDYAPQNQLLAMTGMANGLSFESLWFLDVLALPGHADPSGLLARTEAEIIADLGRPGLVLLVPTTLNAGLTLLLSRPAVIAALARYRQMAEVNGYALMVAD